MAAAQIKHPEDDSKVAWGYIKNAFAITVAQLPLAAKQEPKLL